MGLDDMERDGGRTVPLPKGRRLLIRDIGADDVDALIALYNGLDAEDRYRRFFANYHPSREFFERMATVGTRGGVGLVAIVLDEDGDEAQLVAEAGCVLVRDGLGELDITIAAGWRGWLGPYLLDALATSAAARGIANIQADVLTTNGPMLAVLRSRCPVHMDHLDWSVVRLLIGTSGSTPSWPGPHDRPRVLVERPGGRWHAEETVRAAGLQVLTCPGPSGRRHRCPALDGEPCPLAAGADAIVISRPGPDGGWPELVGAHASMHPGVPVCIESASPETGAGEIEGCPTADDDAVVSFVERLVRRRPDLVASLPAVPDIQTTDSHDPRER